MSNPTPVTAGFEISNSSGDIIRGDVRYREDGRNHPAVIVCHSFMAFKDWGFFPHVGEELARAGFFSVVFNFSHNGVTGKNPRITDFDRFAENTFSKELEDLRAVVDAVDDGTLGAHVAKQESIGLMGHSRGAGIAILHASSDVRIGALVSWSAVATFDRWTPHQKKMWRERGFLPMSSDPAVSKWQVGVGLLDDIEQRGESLNIPSAASRIQIPWLILHGAEDLTVRPREGELLYSASGRSTTEFVLLEHAGHLFHGSSPEEDGYKTLNNALGITSAWFSRHLSKEHA